ncbi:SPW repeat-containing protein [Thermomonospora echinospora]|uniref:SPW repeat-containing protein n=1 Tax=Thermomonospora echinospora TaxID=1992 RepID=A0A1H6BUX8_9ACTN|nr:SPW repeat protein [Thermomonospora echinospora]SEG64460.1 SPW repeat-containing protein [Thermomonospora echinospora]
MGRFAWQDAVAFVAGLAVVLAPELWADGAGRQPLMVLGALLALAGLYALLGAAGPSAWTSTAFAVLVFVSPWAFGFTGEGAAAWTAWIAGGAAAIVGLWTATQTLPARAEAERAAA